MRKTVFIKNAAILTISSLILRFAGIIFKIWLAALIGSEGIGLYHLIFSVYVLASTFASSGISTAVTRLVADELALGSKKGTLKILTRCIQISLLVSILSIFILVIGADFIAVKFLNDARAAAALKILPFSLPFMGVSSCLKGFFIASRRVTPNVISQLSEQAVRISVVVILVKTYIGKDLGACCSAVILGDVISEGIGFLIIWFKFLYDKNKLNALSGRIMPPYKITKQIMHIAMPITSSRYLNNVLRTLENVLVPKNLMKFKIGGDKALSLFGMIKGMALPILFFPSALLNSISILLIPEMSEAAAKNQPWIVKSATEKILRLTAVISFVFSAIFFVAGEKIGFLIYKNAEVGTLLKALSPIVPIMYLDSISDGILKGLDQQRYTFFSSVSDSSIRIILISLLLPKLGLRGFLLIMYFSNAYTCILSLVRLIKISKATFQTIKEIILPVFSAFTISFITDTLLKTINIRSALVYIMLLCCIALPCYCLSLFLFGTITRDDLKLR